MKKILYPFILILLMTTSSSTFGQAEVYTRWHFGELLFQGSVVERNQTHIPTNMRFTMFFHFGFNANLDFNDWLGVYSGLSVRNVGFIYNEYLDLSTQERLTKNIIRTYNLGVPLMVKLGTFDKHFFLFAGGEVEFPFHFKHKYWPDGNGNRNGQKLKSTQWFSGRTPSVLPSLQAGVQFPGGINLKFKYYMTNYVNQDYTDSDGTKPYENFNAQVYYVSLSWSFSYKSVTKMWDDEDLSAR